MFIKNKYNNSFILKMKFNHLANKVVGCRFLHVAANPSHSAGAPDQLSSRPGAIGLWELSTASLVMREKTSLRNWTPTTTTKGTHRGN